MRDLVERSKGQQHLVPGKGLGKRRHLTRYKVTVITGMVKMLEVNDAAMQKLMLVVPKRK